MKWWKVCTTVLLVLILLAVTVPQVAVAVADIDNFEAFSLALQSEVSMVTQAINDSWAGTADIIKEGGKTIVDLFEIAIEAP